MSELYQPRVPTPAVTDFDTLVISIALSSLADRHSDGEILAMLTPEKVRACLNEIRQPAASQQKMEG